MKTVEKFGRDAVNQLSEQANVEDSIYVQYVRQQLEECLRDLNEIPVLQTQQYKVLNGSVSERDQYININGIWNAAE